MAWRVCVCVMLYDSRSGLQFCMYVMQYGFTPLHLAAHYGNLGMVHALLDRHANVNIKDWEVRTGWRLVAGWG